MKNSLHSILVKKLRELTDKLDKQECELSADEMQDILNVITHKALSKESACKFLNLSRSRFDDLVREGKIPKGRKRTGFKELVWYEDELRQCISR